MEPGMEIFFRRLGEKFLPDGAFHLGVVGDVADLLVVGEPVAQLRVEPFLRTLADSGHPCADGVQRADELALVPGEGRLEEDDVCGHSRKPIRTGVGVTPLALSFARRPSGVMHLDGLDDPLQRLLDDVGAFVPDDHVTVPFVSVALQSADGG